MTDARRRVGDTVGVVFDSLRIRSYRRWALVAAAIYLVVYLFAIRDLVVSPRTDLTRFVAVPSIQVASDWASKVFKPIGSFSYEPVVAIYPINHVTLFVSPVNLVLGLLLGGLFGLNVALALRLMRSARTCRTRSLGGLIGALPGFLSGVTCCVPTVALVLGAQFAVTLIALRSYLFPFAVGALLLSLAWNANRARPLLRDAATVPSLPELQLPAGGAPVPTVRR